MPKHLIKISLRTALSDPTLPVGEMLVIDSSTVPAWVKSEAKRNLPSVGWSEMYQPMQSLQDEHSGCKFGCKVYGRRRGAVIEYAVFHSLTYGHSHSPFVR